VRSANSDCHSRARLQQVTLLTRDNPVTYRRRVDNEDLVFKALADATRRLLLDKLFERDGMTLGEVEAEAELTGSRFMKHLGVLDLQDSLSPRVGGSRRAGINDLRARSGCSWLPSPMVPC
jgi:DNA-binding transcriptional ArsR family regulator